MRFESTAFCAVVAYLTALHLFYPYVTMLRRSQLTETLLQKYAVDEKHRADQHRDWYELDVQKLDENMQLKFIQLKQDEATSRFLENCFNKSDSILWQMWHSLAVPFLKMFMTQTSVNGYLDRGSMFVYSSDQFHQLIDANPDAQFESLLDLGAGDGKVTSVMKSNFEQIYVTEVSYQMRRRLENCGFHVLEIDDWSNRQYDVISCLNLLDRCDKPFTLLQDIHAALTPTGTLIVALVLPFSPYVEENDSQGYQPTEKLHVTGSSIEEQVGQIVENVFEPSGFHLERFTRLPYLCEGDMRNSFYVLNDVVFVLKHANIGINGIGEDEYL